MRDLLIDQFRERLTGHEMDVPPGAWGYISGRLAAASGDVHLREGMQRKFHGHEVEVDSAIWANINGQLGATGAGGIGAGWIAAGISAMALTAGLLIWGRVGPKDAGQTDVPNRHMVVAPAPVVGPLQEPAPEQAPPMKEAATAIPITPEPGRATLGATHPDKLPERPIPDDHEVAASGPDVRPEAVQPKNTMEGGPTSPSVTGPADHGMPAARPAMPEMEPARPEHAPGTQAETLAVPMTGAQPSAEHEAGQPETGPDALPENPFAPAEGVNAIMIPNVFSPQGDGINDRLKIVVDGYERVDVRVFSVKSGSLVFHTNDLGNMWDGRLPNGNNAEEGYYRCVVRMTGSDGSPRTKAEVVRLFR